MGTLLLLLCFSVIRYLQPKTQWLQMNTKTLIQVTNVSFDLALKTKGKN